MAGGGIRLFVYGSLLAGEAFHHRLMGRTKFLGKAETARGFTLLDLGNYPGMIVAGNGTVDGELYEVDETTLRAIDQLEGHPHFYRRVVIPLAGGVEAYAYILPKRAAERFAIIPEGDWRAALRRR